MLFDENSIKYLDEGKTLSGLESRDNYICCTTEFNCFLSYWVRQIEESLVNLNAEEVAEILNEVDAYDSIDDLMDDTHFCPNCMHLNRKFVGGYLAILLDRFVKVANEPALPIHLSNELKEVSKTHFGYMGQCMFLMNNIWQCSGELQLLRAKVDLPTSVSENARKAANARHAPARKNKEVAFKWFEENGYKLTADQAAQAIANQHSIALRTAIKWVTDFRKKIRSACK